MKRKNEAHELVLQCLTEALLKLMEKKPFNEINVSELCEKAGVARASFYRNYDSMQEILTNYLSSVTDEWWEEFVKYPEDEFHEKVLLHIPSYNTNVQHVELENPLEQHYCQMLFQKLIGIAKELCLGLV